MTKRIAVLVGVGVAAAAASGSSLADPGSTNGHNCAGLTSTFVPPGLGQEVAGTAHLFPTAIPSLLDFANCGGNGFPP